MVNHKEILRLKSLGLTHQKIADAAGCGRNTVTRTLTRARKRPFSGQQVQFMSQQEISLQLFPTESKGPVYKMPDYEWVHREMQKSSVTLSLLLVECCETMPPERQAGLQIHPVQQVLRRLYPQNESHHAPGAQAW